MNEFEKRLEAERIRDDEVKKSALTPYDGPPPPPSKSNPSLPDQVWDQLQDMGQTAVNHLERLLHDKKFEKLAVKEQMRVIETTLARAYGAVDGGVRRNLHVHMDPGNEKGYNALAELSNRAVRTLPEFKGNVHPLVGKDVKRHDKSVSDDTLDAEPTKDVSGDRN